MAEFVNADSLLCKCRLNFSSDISLLPTLKKIELGGSRIFESMDRLTAELENLTHLNLRGNRRQELESDRDTSCMKSPALLTVTDPSAFKALAQLTWRGLGSSDWAADV